VKGVRSLDHQHSKSIPDHLQVVVCGDEVQNGKPAHDVFTEAGKKLSVDPSKILVIEDAPSGIQVSLSLHGCAAHYMF
jgi:HAD superfamily hydrolase (TIGR01509 family)